MMARWSDPTVRMIACALIALAYFVYSNALLPIPSPGPRPDPVPNPAVDEGLEPLLPFARAMTRSDRTALSQAYAILAAGVSSDTSAEPVFARVAQIRQGHRAAVLMVWSAMGNGADKYPGLGPALEKLLSASIGDSDVVVTPDIRRSASELFQSISDTFK